MNFEDNKVAEVIRVLRSGVDFYVDVIDEVDNRDIKRVFIRMVEERELAIKELKPFASDEQCDDKWAESLANNVQSLYNSLLGKLYFDNDHTYIVQLRNVEGKTLEAIDQALAQNQPKVCLQHLSKVRGVMQSCQDNMKVLKLLTT